MRNALPALDTQDLREHRQHTLDACRVEVWLYGLQHAAVRGFFDLDDTRHLAALCGRQRGKCAAQEWKLSLERAFGQLA